MAKSAKSRLKVSNLQRKWITLSAQGWLSLNPLMTSFGRVFSSDPFDCGNPRCCLCSREKVLHHKKERANTRKIERLAFEELMEKSENYSVE